MIYTKFFLLLLFLQLSTIYSSCEAYWLSNISSSYSSSIGLSEPGNAISSLSYTLFGLIGIFTNNNTVLYYIIMNLFIILGLFSFLHHYFYYNAKWAYSGDIISMIALAPLSLVYIICDNNNKFYKYQFITKIFNFMIISFLIIMLIFNEESIDWKTLYQITIAGIIVSQLIICLYFLYIKSFLNYRILYSSIYSGVIFTIGVNLWILDNECPSWVYLNKFNGHAIWHITLSWALFNVLNVTNVFRYTYNNIKFKWVPMFKRVPWFLYIIYSCEEKSNMIDNGTNINFSEIKLLIDKKYEHRRVFTQ